MKLSKNDKFAILSVLIGSVFSYIIAALLFKHASPDVLKSIMKFSIMLNIVFPLSIGYKIHTEKKRKNSKIKNSQATCGNFFWLPQVQ
jgi:ABC-type uncharacterized transport system permease subunit